MSQDIWTTTTFILSPLIQQLDTKQIHFDAKVSGLPTTCIVEDENIREYMIHNNISQGAMVRLEGRPLVSLDSCLQHCGRLIMNVLSLKLVDDNERFGKMMKTMVQGVDTAYSRSNSSNTYDTTHIENSFYALYGRLGHIQEYYPEVEKDDLYKKIKSHSELTKELLAIANKYSCNRRLRDL